MGPGIGTGTRPSALKIWKQSAIPTKVGNHLLLSATLECLYDIIRSSTPALRNVADTHSFGPHGSESQATKTATV